MTPNSDLTRQFSSTASAGVRDSAAMKGDDDDDDEKEEGEEAEAEGGGGGIGGAEAKSLRQSEY